MKRFHIHLSVDNLDKNIQFYSALFASQPTVLKNDYAKWQLDDPKINFAISNRGSEHGVDHLGIQVESADELSALQAQLAAADIATEEQLGTTCCYAKSDKYWTKDPQGMAWESFLSTGSAPIFSDQDIAPAAKNSEANSACCAPKAEPSKKSCC